MGRILMIKIENFGNFISKEFGMAKEDDGELRTIGWLLGQSLGKWEKKEGITHESW